jgi:uncharacterized secreted protein with C-terminal beta-propeller domain
MQITLARIRYDGPENYYYSDMNDWKYIVAVKMGTIHMTKNKLFVLSNSEGIHCTIKTEYVAELWLREQPVNQSAVVPDELMTEVQNILK